jgi:hypothetical protein
VRVPDNRFPTNPRKIAALKREVLSGSPEIALKLASVRVVRRQPESVR